MPNIGLEFLATTNSNILKMKIVFSGLLLSAIVILTFANCKKEAIKTPPTVTLASVTNITSNSATTGGDVTSDGGATVTAKGVCWGTNQTPTTSDTKLSGGKGTGSFTSSLTGLNPAATYYIRAYATNSVGTSYGGQETFTTLADAPLVTTTAISAMTNTTGSSGGTITSDGGSTILAKGVCWATTTNPTISNSKTTDGTGSNFFTSNITGLTSGTAYYLRAYATNSIATSYGNEVTFTPGTVTDIDGNLYHYIVIGTQTWMVENLKTTKYRNGDAIANVTGDWSVLVTGAYSWYNNDATTYRNSYGALYNWYAVADSRNIAPLGWHVPTDVEWTTLTDYLNGTSVAGGKLKETGTAHWKSPNLGATNSTGFAALPGGYHNFKDSTFDVVGSDGFWWSSTAGSGAIAGCRFLDFGNANVYRLFYEKQYGFSVRCVRD